MSELSPNLNEVRTPPANLEAEQALLGAILTNNEAYHRASDFLSPDHFADPINGQIYEAIAKRIEGGRLADAITMNSELLDILSGHDGEQYIADLMGAMVNIISARDYAYSIHDCWIRRQLVGIGSDIVNDAFISNSETKGSEQIEKAESFLFDLANDKGQTGATFTPLKNALSSAIETASEAMKHGGGLVGLTTGFTKLDEKIGGLHRSDLVILAGRPGMGKTALGVNIAFNAAKAIAGRDPSNNSKNKGSVAFFSLEMSSEQLGMRIISSQAKIPGERIRKGDLGKKDFTSLSGALNTIGDTPLNINDTPSISISALRTHCRRLKRTSGLELVVIDYLQLMQPPTGRRYDSPVQSITAISQGLKALAKELDIPVIALSQLSRAVEQRENKRPQLSDLRESGSIEQDADMVMFVYRDSYYRAKTEPSRADYSNEVEFKSAKLKWEQEMDPIYTEAELIIAKQRHGSVGSIRLHFDGAFTSFSDPK